MTTTGIPRRRVGGVLRIYLAPGLVAPVVEHSDVDEPSGTWTILAGLAHGSR